MLRSVKGDDAAWVIILTGQQVLDHRFQAGVLAVRLAPDRPLLKSSATKYTV